jgi:hypothetical protein
MRLITGGLATPSLPWKLGSVTRVHSRSLATRFRLEISVFPPRNMRRETSRASFLMCPFCARVSVPNPTTRSTEHRSRALALGHRQTYRLRRLRPVTYMKEYSSG